MEAMNRTPPSDVEAEKAILGAALIAGHMPPAMASLKASDFFLPAHRDVFEAILSMAAQRKALDALLIADTLGARGIKLSGDPARFLLDLAGSAPASWEHVAPHYAKIIADKAALRRLIELCSNLQGRAWEGSASVGDLIMDFQRGVRMVATGLAGDNDPVPIGDATQAELDAIEMRSTGKAKLGLPTGFGILDRVYGGMGRERMILLAGRPGKGKSAAAGCFATGAAAAGHPVLFLSGEMGMGEVANRFISAESGIDGLRLATGRVDSHDWPAIFAGVRKLQGRSIWVYAENLTLGRIDSVCQRWYGDRVSEARAEGKPAPVPLIVVDYLQLVRAPAAESGDRTVGQIGKACKALAKDLKCPVLVVSSMNREIEKRDGGKPQLSDLRESGQIEFDADMVIFVDRPDLDVQPELQEADFVIKKNRGGPVGRVRVLWKAKTTQFLDVAREYGDYDPQGDDQ